MSENTCRGPRKGQPTMSEVVVGGLTLKGASVSAYKTFIFCRELGVIFDIGDVSEEMLAQETVFISHGHQDHLLGITRYAGLRRLQHMAPPTIVIPAELADDVNRLFDVWSGLESLGNRRPPEFTLVGAREGDEIPIPGRRIAKAVPGPACRARPRIHDFRKETAITPGVAGTGRQTDRRGQGSG